MTVVTGIFGRTAHIDIDEANKMLDIVVKRKRHRFPFSALRSIQYHGDGHFARARQWQMPIALAVMFGLLGTLTNSLGGMLIAAAVGAYIGQQLAKSHLFEQVAKTTLTISMSGEHASEFNLIFFDLNEAARWEEILRQVQTGAISEAETPE